MRIFTISGFLISILLLSAPNPVSALDDPLAGPATVNLRGEGNGFKMTVQFRIQPPKPTVIPADDLLNIDLELFFLFEVVDRIKDIIGENGHIEIRCGGSLKAGDFCPLYLEQ